MKIPGEKQDAAGMISVYYGFRAGTRDSGSKNSCPTFSSLLMAARICSGVDAGGGETVGLVGTAEVTEVAETAGRAEEGRVDAGSQNLRKR